ncbi:MAG: hypothetical protein CMJ78_21075 [Planctomycetaceae bacterium]|nr:hypothetical protein [Planctomycetaceae bacterium]
MRLGIALNPNLATAPLGEVIYLERKTAILWCLADRTGKQHLADGNIIGRRLPELPKLAVARFGIMVFET